MKTLAIYPGSFNPFTVGHLNVAQKSKKIFGNVLIAIGRNPSKVSKGEDTSLERAKYISEKTEFNVECYDTFLHQFVNSKESEGYNVIIVRGLRNGDDLSYEQNQLRFMQDFKPEIQTVFIMCDKQFEHISSTAIRQLESFEEGSSKKYLI